MPQRLFLAAVLMALAGFAYRLNCFLIGYDTGPGGHYFPSIAEMLVTMGMFAIDGMKYDKAADADSWKKTLELFKEALGR